LDSSRAATKSGARPRNSRKAIGRKKRDMVGSDNQDIK
jgi:hypothetical protein